MRSYCRGRGTGRRTLRRGRCGFSILTSGHDRGREANRPPPLLVCIRVAQIEDREIGGLNLAQTPTQRRFRANNTRINIKQSGPVSPPAQCALRNGDAPNYAARNKREGIRIYDCMQRGPLGWEFVEVKANRAIATPRQQRIDAAVQVFGFSIEVGPLRGIQGPTNVRLMRTIPSGRP